MNSDDLKKRYDNRLKNIEMAMKHPLFRDYYPAWMINKITESTHRARTSIPECDHEWKKYEGVTEVYNYCTKCDVKENA